MVGPDYTKPAEPIPEKFDRPLPAGMNASTPRTERWWLEFNDPLLNEFIARAELQNLDLKVAVANLELFRARYNIQFAQLFPDINANFSYSRVQINNNAIGIQSGADSQPFNRWSYGMDMATWELDIWGKIRRQIQAAEGRFEATAEDYRGALVSIRADVAQAYIAIRTLQGERKNAKDLAEALAQVVKLTEAQLRAQTSNLIDLAEAKARYSASVAEISRVESQLTEQINGLSVLLGEMPGQVRRQVEKELPIPQPSHELAVGIPADLIRRRPDIRSAERSLMAATSDIGVAEADFLPTLSLSGGIGVDAGSFSGMGNVSGNLTYLFGPSVSWDFFKIVKGQTQAEVNAAKARTLIALLAYQRTMLEAMKQVDTAIANYTTSRGVRDNYAKANAEVTGAYDLAMRKYDLGVINLQQLIQFLEVLIQSRNGLVQGQGFVAQNLVEVYRSLGGGWETSPLPPAADPVAPLIAPEPESTQASASKEGTKS